MSIFKKKQAPVHNAGPQLISESAPFEYVEAYNAFRTNFNFVTVTGKNRKILVTSTIRDEGKTSLSINLSISLAQAGAKVLLIDADMRNPSVHRYMRLKKDPNAGLSNLLTGEVKVGNCMISTDVGVDVIAGGSIPPNPAELIGSDAMKNLLDVAAEHYDYIICDAPPVGVITDAAALSPLCDGVLFVIRQKFANRNQIWSAIKSLQTVNAKILGTILTQYEIPKKPSKYHKSSVDYYGYYSSEEVISETEEEKQTESQQNKEELK